MAPGGPVYHPAVDRRPLAAALLAAALGAACASAPTPPPPSLALLSPQTTAAPALPEGEAARLDEAARLLADGTDLPVVARLLAAADPADPRRDLLAGQLAELSGDDAAAEAAYGHYLSRVEDDEVRLRRALALERLGRAEEVRADLDRLRPAQPGEAKGSPPPRRKLRPLLPSSR